MIDPHYIILLKDEVRDVADAINELTSVMKIIAKTKTGTHISKEELEALE